MFNNISHPATDRGNGNMKRRALAALYSILVLAYLGFLFYYLTLRPGGADGNPVVIKSLIGFVSGGMIMMAVYAVTLSFFRRGEKAMLYFALFCFAGGIRFLVAEGNMILTEIFPGLSDVAAINIYGVTIGITVIGIVCLNFELFATPDYKKRLPYFIAAITIIHGAGAIIAALLGDLFITRVALLLVSEINFIHILFMIAKSPGFRTNKICKLHFVSVLLFIGISIFTALSPGTFPNLAVISNSVLIIVHTILLSDRYSRAISENELLDKLNRTKTEFLQDMSHEMKAPLTVIATGIDFADREIHKESAGLERAAAALDNIREETQRLGRMVGGMVNLASMSEISENRKRIDFAALLRNSAETFRPALEQRNNRLSVEIAPGLPDVFVEHDQFARVMTNLLSNAADHTRDGQLILSADFDSAFITVRLSDTGDGIERPLLPKVFGRGVSGRGGTGYGLYICKTVVEAHGGTINIESEAGRGTAVTFTVPVYGGQEAGHRL